jgi:hypothetical protein
MTRSTAPQAATRSTARFRAGTPGFVAQCRTAMRDERKAMRTLRRSDIREQVRKSLGRELENGELASLARLSDQDLHLIVAAFDNK